MHRWAIQLMTIGITAASLVPASGVDRPARGTARPELQTLAVPAAHTTSIATRLNLRYRDVAGVKIAPDVPNEQLLIMAPPQTQQAIAIEVQKLLSQGTSADPERASPLRMVLNHLNWRQFETVVRRIDHDQVPVTTSGGGASAAFQLTSPRLRGTTVQVDRQRGMVTVAGSTESLTGWKTLIETLDQPPDAARPVVELVRFEQAEPAPIQKAIRLLRELDGRDGPASHLAAPPHPVFRNAVFQQENENPDVDDRADPNQTGASAGDANGGETNGDPATDGSGVLGDPQIQIIPELGQVIIKGTKRDAQRIMELIQQIEAQSKLTKPEVEIVPLEHADANAVAVLLTQLYADVLSARQGQVDITSLDTPNALLLIGRKEAIASIKEIIAKIDQPIAETSRLRVFRLQHAAAVDAEQTIRDFFTDRPGVGDELRPSLGTRVRVLSDYRTNSLIVSAAPRDMLEISRLIQDLDVQKIAAEGEIKVFPLKNAVAEDLAPVLQEAIDGPAESEGPSNNPSTSLSILAVDPETNRVIESGILAGTVVTADPGANAIVVRAPAVSMPLIAELIRQLDQPPTAASLVKVFTIENGDAQQLTVALQDLFGSDAETSGTNVGAGNLAGLPPATAAGDSSLVPLRFSTDLRTNSIIASGSAEDLEVVESILLRLDSAGFAERITEVIWLRHQGAEDIATAIQTYVQQRTQTVNTIQQFQQGLGPFDLPDRDLIVVAEPVSNSILLSVSPRLYPDVRRMIDKLDRRPPMVMIQVLLAEVSLDDIFEIGGEVGLQDSLLYDRGIAAAALPGAGPPSVPGFNFNDVGLPGANSFRRGTVGAQGVSSFGVGTTNSALGYGGFVLSAASESVSLLLRTLQEANRLQILSRPQINTMDNTEAVVQVGRTIARVTGVINNVSNTQVVTEDIPVGLILRVRPRVGSDGLIIMEVDVTRSDRDPNNGTPVPTGDGDVVVIDDILETTAQSVVAAYNGQTVVFGGLIQKTRQNFSRRVPFVADIPLLGYLFKYDQEVEIRRELLLVMTPLLISGQEDLDYIKEVESSRMSWCLADVVEAHGDVGLSGGYGLWGPAVGGTIYPDVQPTADDFLIEPAGPPEEWLLGEEPVHAGPLDYDAEAPFYLDTEDVPPTTSPLEPGEMIAPPPGRLTPEPPLPAPVPPPAPQSRFTPLHPAAPIEQTSWSRSSPPRSPGDGPRPTRLGHPR